MNKQNKIKLEHIGRVYEAAKDSVYKGDQKAALDNLQELRNIACEQLQQLDALSDDADEVICIAGFLKCVFGSKIEVGFDYLQLLLFSPFQRLPVVVLSGDQEIGKTRFAKFLHTLLPLDSVALINDMSKVFTEEVAQKRLLIVDEVSLINKEARNKLRAIATCDKYEVKRRWRANKEVDFTAKIIFITNDPAECIKQLEGYVPYWHIQMQHQAPAVDYKGIPSFLKYLRDRTLHTPHSTPTWFHPTELK